MTEPAFVKYLPADAQAEMRDYLDQPERYAPETTLLVRLHTNATRIIEAAGGERLSRQSTSLSAGETVTVVQDEGASRVLVAWGKQRYRVYRGDLMPMPSPREVAHLSVRALAAENALAQLRTEYARLFEERAQLLREITPVRVERDAALTRLARIRQALDA